MKLKTLIKSSTAALLLSAGLASAEIPAEYAADPVIQQISEQLAAQGYEITEVVKTFLGRYKIEAVAPGYVREIVVTAGGNAVLRDEWQAIVDAAANSDWAGMPEGTSMPDVSSMPEGSEMVERMEEAKSRMQDAMQSAGSGSAGSAGPGSSW